MKLTAHFDLDEFLRSGEADREGIAEQYAPPVSVVKNLTALAENVLEPVRAKLALPITVTSGYRCPRINKSVGGSTNSDHMRGQAADLKCADMMALWNALQTTPFKQLIWYFEDDLVPEFVHVSYDPADIRKQVMICYLATDANGVEKRHYRTEK